MIKILLELFKKCQNSLYFNGHKLYLLVILIGQNVPHDASVMFVLI